MKLYWQAFACFLVGVALAVVGFILGQPFRDPIMALALVPLAAAIGMHSAAMHNSERDQRDRIQRDD